MAYRSRQSVVRGEAGGNGGKGGFRSEGVTKQHSLLAVSRQSAVSTASLSLTGAPLLNITHALSFVFDFFFVFNARREKPLVRAWVFARLDSVTKRMRGTAGWARIG